MTELRLNTIYDELYHNLEDLLHSYGGVIWPLCLIGSYKHSIAAVLHIEAMFGIFSCFFCVYVCEWE